MEALISDRNVLEGTGEWGRPTLITAMIQVKFRRAVY